MTKDIGYVIKIEDGNNEFWIRNVDDLDASTNPKLAQVFNTQEGVKEAAKRYFSSIGNTNLNRRVFVQEVKYTDIACWNKSDIDLLLEGK